MAQRIPDAILDKVAFLYPTEEEAKQGVPTGGSAFFMSVPWESKPEYAHIYAVTNKHVIEPPIGRSSLVLRLNLKSGGTDTVVTNADEWVFPASGDDLAARLCFLDGIGNYKVGWESTSLILTDEVITKFNLGIGDEVFSVGRFLDAEDAHENRPVLRFGQMSAFPPVLVRWSERRKQESYLVEMRSRTGFSGSPVYIYVDPSMAGEWVARPGAATHTKNLGLPIRQLAGPWILGVHWGQLPVAGPDMRDGDKHYGSGVSAVVPGQTLLEFLLEDGELKRSRKALEDDWNNRPHAMQEGALKRPTEASVAPKSDNPSHREDFTHLLDAAAKTKQ